MSQRGIYASAEAEAHALSRSPQLADIRGMTLAFARVAVAVGLACAATGCEYALSDVATRIRYALVDAHADLQSSASDTLTIRLRPDHWPDACPDGRGYRVKLIPYQGNKQVAVGDIDIACHGKGVYWTGFGSEQIYVAHELAVDKTRDQDLVITLHKSAKGSEIVTLE
jgi:hypothetical protein